MTQTKWRLQVAISTAALIVLATCGAITSNSRAVFILVDASGTYADNMDEAVLSSRLLASNLNPNDWLGFAQISSCSFSDDGVVVQEKLPGTPSRAALSKQQIFGKLNAYSETFKATGYTDIRGALRYAAYELEQSSQAARYIVIYSDMVEDVSPDCDTSQLELELTGITVLASNVTKLRSDAQDPARYFARLQEWEDIVTEAGGIWIHAATQDQLLDRIF